MYVIIMGAGRVGLNLASALIKAGFDVTLLAVSYTHLTLPTKRIV